MKKTANICFLILSSTVPRNKEMIFCKNNFYFYQLFTCVVFVSTNNQKFNANIKESGTINLVLKKWHTYIFIIQLNLRLCELNHAISRISYIFFFKSGHSAFNLNFIKQNRFLLVAENLNHF